jgi:Plasmid replication region DNA-binding N-term
MDLEQVQEAVSRLLQQGLTWDEISAPWVREVLGFGSYRDICQHIATLCAEQPAEVIRESVATPAAIPEEQGQEALSTPSEEPAPDPVAEAEAEVRQVQTELQCRLDVLPEAEHELADARARVIAAIGTQLAVVEAHRRGLLSGDDPGRAEAAREVDEAASAYRQALQGWRWACDAVSGWNDRLREA